jgi:hypothetical protein
MCGWTSYNDLCVLHRVGSAGHIVDFSASGRKTSKHYFSCLGGTCTDFIKSAPGHVTPNSCYCLMWDLRAT